MIRFYVALIIFSILPNYNFSDNSFIDIEKFKEEANQLSLILQAKDNILILAMRDKQNEIEIINFMKKLAKLESAHNWKIINKYGYVGKYQFGTSARKAVGAPKFTWKQFKRNPYIWTEHQQDSAVVKLMKLNYTYLKNHFNTPGDNLDDFINIQFTLKDKSTVKITYAGLLASSHLVGAGSVRKFLNTRGRYDNADANGTKLTKYMKHFENNELMLK